MSFEWVRRVLQIGDVDIKVRVLASVLGRTDTKKNAASNIYYTNWIDSFDDHAFNFLTSMSKS